MKMLSDLLKENYSQDNEGKNLIHCVQNLFHVQDLKEPVPASEVTCPMCGGNNGMTFLMEVKPAKRKWFCVESVCLTSVARSHMKMSQTMPKKNRAILWPKFCEFNGIGDLFHDVCFEKIEQSAGKIEYLKKFVAKPRGIIMMQGQPGTGKTYCCLGLCELFTRVNTSCFFFTQDRLIVSWLDAMKTDKSMYFRDKVETASILVVDDFGTRQPPAGFMQFFMDVMNTRLQWSDRGTVITTNLEHDKMSEFCGEALTDRLKTGQKFEFKGVSRRKETVL